MPGGGSLHPATAETVEKKYALCPSGRVAGLQVCGAGAWPRCRRSFLNGTDSQRTISLYLFLTRPTCASFAPRKKRLGVDDSKVLVNIDRYANTTAGTIPLGLWDAVKQGRLHKGDLALIVTVGAGYTTGGVLLSLGLLRRSPICAGGTCHGYKEKMQYPRR